MYIPVACGVSTCDPRFKQIKVDLCPPCGINYNFVLKAESITDEMNYLISRHNLNSSFPCIASAPNGTMKSNEDIQAMMHKAYQPLSLEHRRQLLHFYKSDFDFFDYKWNITTLEISLQGT